MVGANDGTRTLVKSIMDREMIAALDHWRQIGLGGMLTGSIAVSFYGKPRHHARDEEQHGIRL